MADFSIKSKHDEEVEELARNLRRNRLASSDSEASRMAEEMLSTGKKVHDDFAERERKIYGDQKKNPEVELAHKQIEQLASNLARGRANVRIDIPEIDVSKPLKELVRENEALEAEDDEVATEVKEGPAGEPQEEPSEEATEEQTEEPEEEPEAEEQEPEDAEAEAPKEAEEELKLDDDQGDVGPGDEPAEPVQIDEPRKDDDEDRDEGGDKDDDKSGDDSVFAKEASSEEGEHPDGDDGEEGESDFTVKEIDNSEQLKKSDEERKAERANMPESKVDLSNMFKVNK